MTEAERLASSTHFAHLVWDGANVTADLPSVLVFGSPEVEVVAPPAIAGRSTSSATPRSVCGSGSRT